MPPTLSSFDKPFITPQEIALLCCFIIGFSVCRGSRLSRRRTKQQTWSSKIPDYEADDLEDSARCAELTADIPDNEAEDLEEVSTKLVRLVTDAHYESIVLPLETNAEISGWLSLGDSAELAATSTSNWHRFGMAADAWCTRAAQSGLCCIVGNGNMREAFRQNYFRVTIQFLQTLSSAVPDDKDAGCVAVLVEAAHVMRGLMPRDGKQVIDKTCQIAERALQAHNPSSEEAIKAASQILKLVWIRRDIFDADTAMGLENAYSSALHLQTYIDIHEDALMDSMEDDGIISWAAIDNAMEEQRHGELGNKNTPFCPQD
jgi:hypothetical protein